MAYRAESSRLEAGRRIPRNTVTTVELNNGDFTIVYNYSGVFQGLGKCKVPGQMYNFKCPARGLRGVRIPSYCPEGDRHCGN